MDTAFEITSILFYSKTLGYKFLSNNVVQMRLLEQTFYHIFMCYDILTHQLSVMFFYRLFTSNGLRWVSYIRTVHLG